MKANTIKAIKKVAVFTIAALSFFFFFEIPTAEEVKAQQCYFYNYNDMVPVEVWKDGVKTTEYRPRAYTCAEMEHNLELLENINKISEAQLAANQALEIANGTLSQINNIKSLIPSKQQEVVANPGLQPQLDELNTKLVALTNQYNAQLADYQTKQAVYENLTATLPTAGYNPNMCNALYGQPKNK